MKDKKQIIIDEGRMSGITTLQKQLVRKTQKCESLKQEIEILQNNFDTATRDCNELIEELRQECEELKEKLYQIEDVVKPINEQLPEDNVIRQIMLILNDCNRLEPSRYRKALDEIEDITQNHIINDFSNWNMGEISDDIVADYVTANCKQILDIINKAKGR